MDLFRLGLVDGILLGVPVETSEEVVIVGDKLGIPPRGVKEGLIQRVVGDKRSLTAVEDGDGMAGELGVVLGSVPLVQIPNQKFGHGTEDTISGYISHSPSLTYVHD